MSNNFISSALVAFFAFSLSLSTFAQNASLQKAESLLSTEQVDSAIYYFEMALSQMPGDELLKSKLANIYRMTNHPDKAVDLFETLSKSPDAGFLTYYWYAYVLKMNGDYEKSRTVLMKLKSHRDVVGDPGMVANIEQAIHSCDFAINNKTKISAYNISNEKAVNSAMADFAPVFYGNSILFASKRILQTSMGYTDPNNDFIYSAQRVNNRSLDKSSTLHDPRNMDFAMFQLNFAPFSLSKDGKMFMASSNQFGAGVRHPYIADLKTSSPFEMGYATVDNLKELNTQKIKHFPHHKNLSGFPHLSPDGKTLYFAGKDLPGISYGGYDIYVCYLENGNWSTPVNLGANINTSGDEISPFVDEEGILYFASEGHLGFGGFDVFRAEQINGTWKDIRNLGYGVNSSQDDLYFIYDYPNEMGYFSSNRKGGNGDYDIYSAAKMGDISMLPKVLETETEHIVVKEADPKRDNPVVDNNKPLIDNIDIAGKDNTKTTDYNKTPTNDKPNYAKKPTTEDKIPCAENAYIGVLSDASTKVRLAEASVFVTNLKTKEMRKVFTSKYGEYAVLLDPETAYEIRCSRQGYENIIFEIYTGDGLKRTLLGDHAMVSSATNTSFTEEDLAGRGLAGRGITNNTKEDFLRSSSVKKPLPAKAYQIQIGVFKDLGDDIHKEFSSYANIITEKYKDGEASIYRLGVFADEAHAKAVLAKVQKSKGFEKSFIKTVDIESRTSADRMNNEVMVVYPKSAATAPKENNLVKIDDPELNIELGDNPRNTNPKTNTVEPAKEVIIKETPHKSYADNPMPGEFTSRGVTNKPL